MVLDSQLRGSWKKSATGDRPADQTPYLNLSQLLEQKPMSTPSRHTLRTLLEKKYRKIVKERAQRHKRKHSDLSVRWGGETRPLNKFR